MNILKDKPIKGSVEELILRHSYAKYRILSKDNTMLFWNTSLLSCIDENGIIKRNFKEKALDSLYKSYGIDLTKEIKLSDSSIIDEKKYLIARINDLKSNNYSESRNPSLIAKELKLYQAKLSKFKNSNNTYNRYVLRKKKFDYSCLEKLIASFLVTTGQVVFKNSKYVYKDNVGRFYKVIKSKSYDILEPFYQKVFTKTYRIGYKDKGIDVPFTNKLLNRNILIKTHLKYNLAYPCLIYSKIIKLSKSLRESDARQILKSLYEYKESKLANLKGKENYYVQEKLYNISKGICYAKNGNYREAKRIIKKSLNTKFIKSFKNDLDTNLKMLIGICGEFFYTKKEVEDNFVAKDKIEDYLNKKL